jgi:tetratricopeptide (TPR) repeat protein
MKQITTLLFFFTTLMFAHAQQPVLRVLGGDSGSVKLRSLHIQVSVTGNIATTTMQMEFCNSTNNVLEGELTFPMPDGVSISRYALDINGRLREAVPVPKEKAQVVFESIARRPEKPDPGLLEKVEGNNFRTRIYPIPAHGCRQVVMAYEQELRLGRKNALLYHLPLQFNYPVEKFSTRFNIYSAATPEVGTDCNTNLRFAAVKNVFTASAEQLDFTPKGGFTVSIPKMPDAAEVQMQEENGQYYFLVNTFPEVKQRERKMPQHLVLLWDASLSGDKRNHEKEFALLDAYFKKAGNMQVTLATVDIAFRTQGSFAVNGGDWKRLKETMEQIEYDGATNFNAINQWPTGEDCLFFTDGLNNWGRFNGIGKAPYAVNTVSAAASADYGLLKLVAAQSGGVFVDLYQQETAAAMEQLTQQPLQLLGVQVNGQVSEVYPSVSTPVVGGCTVAGISSAPTGEIVMQFGYGNQVTATSTIQLDYTSQGVANMSLPRIWAQKKIDQIDWQYEVFKDKIADLGKQYGIVTRNTSLIVLETVADYVRYGITPPAELRAEYDQVVKGQAEKDQQKEARTIDHALRYYQELQDWWKKDFSTPKPVVEGDKPVVRPGRKTLRLSRNGEARFVSGFVKNETGNPLPDATVKVGGTVTVTDHNGYFKLIKPANATTIEISYVGHELLQGRLGNNNVVNAVMKERAQSLDEVAVVVTQGQRARRNVAGAVQTVQADSLPLRVPGDVNRDGADALIRAMPGVQTATASNNAIFHAADATGSTFYRAGAPGAPSSGEVRLDMGYIYTAAPRYQWSPGQSGGDVRFSYSSDTIRSRADAKAIELPNFIPDRAYMKQLDSAGANAYAKYLELRSQYRFMPSYYFDVAQYFLRQKDTVTGLKILSNLADLNLEDHELYKMLGYQLKTIGHYRQALYMFGKVLEWRPQEPHSYRDYGLALADAGLYQNALDTLYLSLLKNFNSDITSLYPGMEEITITEINRLIAAHGKKLNLSKIDQRMIAALPVDVRVVLNWNMNDTDIDLWTFDPLGEKCYYSHKLTTIGGRNSNDFTKGYGPEQFMLRKAPKGKYEVKLHYYGTTVQKLVGGATVMAEIYTNYGKPGQQRRIITLQMEKGKQQDGILVGSFEL